MQYAARWQINTQHFSLHNLMINLHRVIFSYCHITEKQKRKFWPLSIICVFDWTDVSYLEASRVFVCVWGHSVQKLAPSLPDSVRSTWKTNNKETKKWKWIHLSCTRLCTSLVWQPDAGSALDTQFSVQVGRVVGQRKITKEDKTENWKVIAVFCCTSPINW